MKHLSPIYFFVAFFLVCLALVGCGTFDVVIIAEHKEAVEEGASSQIPVQTTPTSERTTPVRMATETPPPTATSTSAPVPSLIASGLVVYETSFDSLPLGRTQPHPGAPGQDGWFEDFSATDAHGEIQSAVAVSGQALHEYKDSSARKFLNSIYLSRYPIITLQVDFYAQVSDLDAVNEYDAFIGFYDNSHPGFEMLGFQLRSGPGPVAKSAGGVNVDINVFNGVNGYDLMRFDVGQDLDWNTWHTVTLIADQAADRYVSLTVDGQTQDLSAYQLPRSYTGHGGWVRGKLIQQLLTHIIQPDGGGSDFGIYWDNLSIIVRPALDETAQVTPIPASQTPSTSTTPHPMTLTPGPLTCQLNINQEIHVLDGTNLWSQPDVVNGSMIGTLPSGTSAYVINGPTWGLIVETGVAGWWWEISKESNGPSAGWIWEGRIEECSTLNVTFTPTPTETPRDENPDKFAFTSCKEVPSGCEIYVMNVDGSNLVQLTDNSDHDHSPAWSPDGTKIAFTSNRDGDYEIYVMNADGSEQMRLTASLHSTSSPNWSPDGTKITFISIYEGIYTMNADGSDVTKILSDSRVMFDLAWSPEGTKMAFIISTSPSRDEIFIMDADGTNLTRLLSAPIGVQNFDPAWSPDGTRIAFTLHDGDLIFKIYVVNADGSNAVFLRNGWSPTWSSDSSKIAYGSCIEDSFGQEICGIYQMDANGGNPVLLTGSNALNFSGLAWFQKPKTQIIQHPDCTSGWTQLEAGSQAEVSSESDTPNRVRSEPGIAGEIIALLYPGHAVFVIEGPICADGLVFWKVESDAIPGGEGWTAEGDGADYWLVPKGP